MKRVFTYLLSPLLTPSVLLCQQAVSTQQEDLWQKYGKDILTLPIVPPICPLSLIGKTSRDVYMEKLEKNIPFHQQALDLARIAVSVSNRRLFFYI